MIKNRAGIRTLEYFKSLKVESTPKSKTNL